MIIAVVGGEGTGKSTLARALGDALALPVLEPLKGSLLASSGYHTLFEWDAATRGLTGLVDKQIEREAALDHAIVDGGAIEIFALVQRWAAHRLSPARFEEMRDAVAGTAARYQSVIVTPHRVVAPPGAGRFRSAPHNLQITRLLHAFVNEAGLASFNVEDASAEARIAAALAAVHAANRPRAVRDIKST